MVKVIPWFESSLQMVKSQLRNKRLHHAILLYGKQGIGKQNLAYAITNLIIKQNDHFEMIASVEAMNVDDFEPFRSNNYPIESIKFIESDSEKTEQISIDQVRDICSTIYLTNKADINKIVVINKVNNLTISGQNALLKILEEPPTNTYFVLLQDENTTVLETIISRCNRYTLNHLTIEDHCHDYLDRRTLLKFNYDLRTILNYDREEVINLSDTIDDYCNDIFDNKNSIDAFKIASEIIEKNLFNLFLNNLICEFYERLSTTKLNLASRKMIYILFDKINSVTRLEKNNFNREMFIVNLICDVRLI